MGERTEISWTDHTFQPWMGCTKVSPGCDHCYAEALGKRTGRVEWGDAAERVPMSEAYWRNPIKWNHQAETEGRRHRVFCASMADVFEGRSDLLEHRARLFELIEATPWLDWQLLTKRPQNVYRHTVAWDEGFPPNVWIGTTVEDQEHAEERIPVLLEIPAAVRFLSCEPLLGPVVLWPEWIERQPRRARPVDWVIAGGESGAGYRPMDLDHVRSLRDQCVGAGIPFFFKQHGGRTPKAGGKVLDGREWCEVPEAVHV